MSTEKTTESLLLSVRPQYASKILSGEKTIELRRRFSRTATDGMPVLLYSSSPVSAVVGCTRIGRVERLSLLQIWREYREEACVSKSEFNEYFAGLKHGYVIALGTVKAFSREVSASRLEKKYGIVPPQSYRYLNGEYSRLLNDGRPQIPSRYKHRDRA
jgi:predicted transcriptional regulator